MAEIDRLMTLPRGQRLDAVGPLPGARRAGSPGRREPFKLLEPPGCG